jgi:hypothetical protein
VLLGKNKKKGAETAAKPAPPKTMTAIRKGFVSWHGWRGFLLAER